MTIDSYEGLQPPKIWHLHYCKEHKTQSFMLYVPEFSKYLRISESTSQISLGFTKTEWNSNLKPTL